MLNSIQFYGEKKPLVSLPAPPENAWLIMISRPRWIQFGRNTLLVTDGTYWLNEKMEDSEIEGIYWKKIDDGVWEVYFPVLRERPIYAVNKNGKKCLVEADEPPEDCGNYIVNTEFLVVEKIDNRLIEWNDLLDPDEAFIWEIEKFMKIQGQYYMPIRSANCELRRFIWRVMNGTVDLRVFKRNRKRVEKRCGGLRVKTSITAPVASDDDLGITVIGNRGDLKIGPLPRVPQNAFLISAWPPKWVQFGNGIFIITRGFLWLKEEMVETNEEDFEWYKEGDEWVIRISSGLPLEGIYRTKNGSLIEVTEEPQFPVVFQSLGKVVTYNRTLRTYIDYYSGTEFTIPGDDLKMVKVEVFGKTFFTPRFYLKGVMINAGN